jgi:hypothetical protein
MQFCKVMGIQKNWEASHKTWDASVLSFSVKKIMKNSCKILKKGV